MLTKDDILELARKMHIDTGRWEPLGLEEFEEAVGEFVRAAERSEVIDLFVAIEDASIRGEWVGGPWAEGPILMAFVNRFPPTPELLVETYICLIGAGGKFEYMAPECLRRAFKLDPRNVYALWRMFIKGPPEAFPKDILFSTNSLEHQKECLQRILATNPSDSMAQTLLDWLEEHQLPYKGSEPIPIHKIDQQTRPTATRTFKRLLQEGNHSLGKPDTRIPTIQGPIEGLTRSCTQILSRLELPSTGQTSPGECLSLWSNMGFIASYLDKERDDSFDHLEERVLKLLESSEGKIISCVEAGIRETLSKMDQQYRQTMDYFSQNGLGSSLTSYEFNDYGLLGQLDAIGFARLFMKQIGREFSSDLVKAVESEEEKLRGFLPKAIQQFRENDDDPTPRPHHFPESFWWRRVYPGPSNMLHVHGKISHIELETSEAAAVSIDLDSYQDRTGAQASITHPQTINFHYQGYKSKDFGVGDGVWVQLSLLISWKNVSYVSGKYGWAVPLGSGLYRYHYSVAGELFRWSRLGRERSLYLDVGFPIHLALAFPPYVHTLGGFIKEGQFVRVTTGRLVGDVKLWDPELKPTISK